MKPKDESDCEEMHRNDSDSEKEKDREKSTEREASAEPHSDNGESDESDLDEAEYERRKAECTDIMSDLERQFVYLRDVLHRERYLKVDNKLFEIRSGRAIEYLQPVEQLQENMKIRTEVAAFLKQFALESIQHQFEAEKLAALQNLESEQSLLMDTMVEELENEIRRLEEDRNSLDVSTALWGEEQPRRAGSRKKPITVSGPYIVYMLSDSDILHDWTIIKKALSANKRKSLVPA